MDSTSTNTNNTSPTFPPLLYQYSPVYPSIIAYTVYFAVFLAWFLLRRDQEPIKSRGWQFVVCSAVASWVYIVIDAIDFDFRNFTLGWYVFSCYPEAFNSALFVPMWFFPYFFRAYVLYLRFRLNDEGVQLAERYQLSSWVFAHRWSLMPRTFFIIYFSLLVIFFLVAIGMIWGLGMNQIDPVTGWGYYQGVSNCLNQIITLIAAQGALCVVGIIVFVILIWKVRDGFGFKIELICILAVGLPILVVWVIQAMGLVDYPYQLPSIVWEELLVFATFNISVVLPTIFSYMPKYNSAVLVITHSGSGSELGSGHTVSQAAEQDRQSIAASEVYKPGSAKFFIQLLDDPVLSEEFKQFCVELWCVENCSFYFAATKFFDSRITNPVELRKKAEEIYNMYIKTGSQLEINIEAPVREKIQEILEGDDEVPQTIFSEAVIRVINIMQTDTYKKFLNNRHFLESFLSSPLGLAAGAAGAEWLEDHKQKLRMMFPAISKAMKEGATTIRQKHRWRKSRAIPSSKVNNAAAINMDSDSTTNAALLPQNGHARTASSPTSASAGVVRASGEVDSRNSGRGSSLPSAGSDIPLQGVRHSNEYMV